MRTTLVLALTLACASAGAAQEREHAPLLVQVPANTRALSMGGAFAIGSSDPAAVFYNPAMSNGSGVALDIQRYGGGGNTVSLAGAADWWGGEIGIGLQSAAYGVDADILLGDIGEGDIGSDGTESVAEHIAAVSYARRIKGLRLGITGKLIDQRAAGEGVTTGGIDLSTGVTVSRFQLGLAVQNLWAGYDFLGLDLDSPLRVTLGGAFARSLPVGPLDLFAAASVSREADGTFVPGGGIEVGYWPVQGRTFFLRGGLRDPADEDVDPWTVGAGFSGDRISLDWAMFTVDGGPSSHRFTVRWR